MRNLILARQFGTRNRKLAEMGFSSYGEYLKSDNWKAIHALIEKKKSAGETFWAKCYICGTSKRIQLHHFAYGKIKKITVSRLYPLCANHHLEAHEYAQQAGVSLKVAVRHLRRRFLST